MRRLPACVTLIAFAACASQTQTPRLLSVQVFERRAEQHSRSVTGQHVFRIEVTNQSDEVVSVDAISLTPDTNLMQFHDSDQIVNEVIEPGQSHDFTMWIDVTAQPINYVYTIDSIDAAITCHSPSKGNFTERGGHTVRVE